ncbi:Panacea domain-containing protein [Mesorhizobium sp. VK9D]|uniref:Panacea domain-containing protein n=1 Tax=Mesorhizobium australafricanum TaxID=3072311 RepID=UPI002A246F22|nr:Panacea domain-containing protein [Mesorhizobium sp. VK9D]MDX8453228.1 Panacea domain-containing protein [Mesorhizobium sp. VK9D]
MTDRAYDRSRLKTLLHYVIWEAGSHANFGATKLYKVAWFADARRFVLTGKSITGAPYIRQEHGPIPRDGMMVRADLEAEGSIRQWRDKVYDHEGWKFKALRPPKVGVFGDDEKALIDYWIGHVDKDHTASSISELSHNYGWEIARMGERIPFNSILAERIRDPNDEEMEWAKKVLKRTRLL